MSQQEIRRELGGVDRARAGIAVARCEQSQGAGGTTSPVILAETAGVALVTGRETSRQLGGDDRARAGLAVARCGRSPQELRWSC